MIGVIDLEDAQATVLGAVAPMAPVDTDLVDVLGRVLAADVVSAEDVPPFANSAVDGYAVRAVDIATAPAELHVVGELAAGAAPYDGVLGAGEAVRIMTGAPVPSGADAVAMVEDSERLDGGRVRLGVAVEAGTAVRAAGDDVRAGEVVLRAGTVVTPAVAGVLASVNARRVSAYPAARVAVLSTGDELVSDGSPLRPGQIRESNATMLAPLLAEAGCIVDHRPVVRDDEAELEAVLRDAAATNDAIVTSGGVSMGDYDVVKAVLGRIADDDVDAGRHQAGQAVRLRDHRRRADLRPARQPGQLAHQLRAVRPSGAAADDGSRPRGPAEPRRHRRRRPASPGRRQGPLPARQRRSSPPTAATTSARSGPRAATSWRPPRSPTRSSCCPTVRAFPPAPRWRSSCCASANRVG